MQQKLNNRPIATMTYENATGPIGFTLKSDLLFHYVMQKSKPALTGLVCALKGIPQSSVKDIIVLNPIDLNSSLKETVMDLKLILNSNEILNIEIQIYPDKYWGERSILYLCRAYDNLKEGEDYSKLKPTTHYCITDVDLLVNNPAFYSVFYLMDYKNHFIYSKNFSIGVVQLQYTDNATIEDKTNNLLYWAQLFKAETWEEF